MHVCMSVWFYKYRMKFKKNNINTCVSIQNSQCVNVSLILELCFYLQFSKWIGLKTQILGQTMHFQFYMKILNFPSQPK